eukprot:gene34887-42246_t
MSSRKRAPLEDLSSSDLQADRTDHPRTNTAKKRKANTITTSNTPQEYLETLRVTENDPGLLISWNPNAVAEFVQAANNPARVQSRPHWIPAGVISPDSLQGNIVAFLRQVGGGSFGTVLIAPNTFSQYGNVMVRLSRDIEMDSFVQECLQELPVGTVLGVLGNLLDRTIANAQPLNRQPPEAPNARLLFT